MKSYYQQNVRESGLAKICIIKRNSGEVINIICMLNIAQPKHQNTYWHCAKSVLIVHFLTFQFNAGQKT